MWSRKPIPLSISARRPVRVEVEGHEHFRLAALAPEGDPAPRPQGIRVFASSSQPPDPLQGREERPELGVVPGAGYANEAVPAGLSRPGPDLDAFFREGFREGRRVGDDRRDESWPCPAKSWRRSGEGRLEERPLAAHLGDERLDGRSPIPGPPRLPLPRSCRASRAGRRPAASRCRRSVPPPSPRAARRGRRLSRRCSS